jgi:sigma-B regulation protein RsbU (phosphoserine phosphatase)
MSGMENSLVTILILVEKLFILLIFAFYAFSLGITTKIKQINILRNIFIVLIVRDILFEIFNLQAIKNIIPVVNWGTVIMLISNIGVIFIYVLWVNSYVKQKSMVITFILMNTIILALVGLHDFYLKFFNTAKGYVYFTVILINIFYFFASTNKLTTHHKEGLEITTRTRILLVFLLGVFNLLYYAFMNNIIFSHAFLLPMSYFVHFYILFNYYKIANEHKDYLINTLTSERESLFEFMQQIGSAMIERIDLDKIFNLIIKATVKNTNADAGTILMVNEQESTLHVRVVEGLYPPIYNVPDVVRVKTNTLVSYFESTPIKIGETVLGEAAKEGSAIFIETTTDDARMQHNNKVDTLSYISSLIAVPLIINKKVMGIVSVIKRNRNQFFSENDYRHVRTFGEYASINIDNLLQYIELIEKREIERELGIAAEIQRKLIPISIPQLPSVDLAVFSKPAHGISGDYYDIFKLDEKKLGLIVCDVAGKGVPAALVMIMIRSIVRLIASPNRDVATTVRWINLGITGRLDIDHYATLCFLTFDSEKREILYSNAAHHPILLYRQKTNKFIQIDTEGLPIGIERKAKYIQKKIPVESGDIFIVYTDGIIEAMNPQGDQYALKSLQKVVSRSIQLPAKEMIEAIKKDIDNFVDTRRQFDDQTLVILKIA